MAQIPQMSTAIVRPTSHDHLKQRLIDHSSQTLNIFYPLAGRLAAVESQDKAGTCFSINCNGDGALFVHAAADDDIVSNLFSMNGVLNYEGVPKPLLAVQVTELVDGIFIGCTMNHCVVDGSSFWHFFNTWEKTAQIKSKANAEMGTHNISSLQALMAHLWRAVTRASHLNLDQEIIYKIEVGLRQKLKPPLPKEYLGNALQGVHVKSTAGELLQHELGWAALHINKTIASLTAEQVMKVLEDWAKTPTVSSKLRENIPTSTTSSIFSLLTGSSPRFNVYGNDFGWGRPVAVQSGSENKMNEGSIDFEVCLLPETLHAMAEDAEFMEAVLT
ncbi:hypothetical protein PRUPE_7G130800 [Prunus persica]|uniref:HXXXD-type acyl-transferase family protein n=1 Tax=Prunus persica TaxID=3760 RepID=A0A251NAU0_PRUPE|nr:hypothetical protein PRUPE_7G130800 [Prunus persica]